VSLVEGARMYIYELKEQKIKNSIKILVLEAQLNAINRLQNVDDTSFDLDTKITELYDDIEDIRDVKEENV
jgi:hypothetical protein